MVRCCVANCTRRSDPCNRCVTFHRFPRSNPKLLKKWVNAMGRPDWSPGYSDLICSDHFNSSDYLRNYVNIAKLKDDAVPSNFEFLPYLTKMLNKNKADKSLQQKENMLVIKYNHGLGTRIVPVAENQQQLTPKVEIPDDDEQEPENDNQTQNLAFLRSIILQEHSYYVRESASELKKRLQTLEEELRQIKKELCNSTRRTERSKRSLAIMTNTLKQKERLMSKNLSKDIDYIVVSSET